MDEKASQLWPVFAKSAIDQQQNECPGALYIFNATLHNVNQRFSKSSWRTSEQLSHIDREIQQSSDIFTKGDAGMARLALRFYRAFIREKLGPCRDIAAQCIRDWADRGSSYRQLAELDALVPASGTRKRYLESAGCSTNKEVINQIKDGYCDLPDTAEMACRRDEDCRTVLAMLDFLDESDSGAAEMLIARLDRFIPKP
ncbi:hypothetical protein [Caulobacter sp. NIBR1757]|uniref:hypothetical protein n=1 Tax=Caulobacter sp. NIBR1757 TaxID=3016000 RepID=UPI0022F06FA5|nr:hypothetical protein [Caulobacter sp. NIBR1757]